MPAPATFASACVTYVGGALLALATLAGPARAAAPAPAAAPARTAAPAPAAGAAQAAAPAPAAVPAPDYALVTPDGVQAILKTPGTEAAGARHPDATVVEYFDYNCPYCKRLAPVLEKLLGTDPQVAVIYKEWPILGDVSVYAARSALAAQWQGKFLAAHTALLAAPQLSRNDQVDAILAAAGIRMDLLAKDRDGHAAQIDSLLARNDEEARALGLKGTPGVMAGRLLLTAEPTFATVKKLVADSRHGE